MQSSPTCVNHSAPRFPCGNPDKVENYRFTGVKVPFDIEIDHRGHAWVTGNGSNNVVELERNGVRIGYQA